MEQNTPYQLDLLKSDPPICRTMLEARDSPRRAYYEIAIFFLSGTGYLIRKMSGGQGARPNVEMWFRTHLNSALKKKAQLIAGKINTRRKGRVYVEVMPAKGDRDEHLYADCKVN